MWRRRSNEAAFQWGTIGMTSLDEPRPNFHGTMMVDIITGRLLPQFPRRTTYIRVRPCPPPRRIPTKLRNYNPYVVA